MKKLLSILVVVMLMLGISGIASATVIEFVPNDTGKVYTTDYNDGYSTGRGMLFEMSQDVTISSLGIFHDLTAINLSYEIATWNTSTNSIGTVLKSGSGMVTTSGLQWIDFAFSDLTLESGNSYHFNFSHNGLGNQNYFYDQQAGLFNQDGFNVIDGTCGYWTDNYVIAGFRVNTDSNAPVPEPATMLLLGLGLIGITGFRKKLQK